MTHERLASPDLLSQAARIKKRKDQERTSVEEAKTRISELQRKILDLLGLGPVLESSAEPLFDVSADGKKTQVTPEFFRRLVANNHGEIGIKPLTVDFSVPVGDEMIYVVISQGLQTTRHDLFRDNNGFEVNVLMLDSIAKFNDKMGVVESKIHNQKPFDMHTPIGPMGNSDLGPVWSRKMNMDDFNDYNALLERLNEPDVVRVER
jgi:hypothetical protein